MSRTRRAIAVAAVLAAASGTAPSAAAAIRVVEVPPDASTGTELAAKGLPAWDRVPTPNIGTGDNQLYGADALASDDIWAVGYHSEDLRDEPLAEHEGVCVTGAIQHYDGAAWTEINAPAPTLESVRAIDADDVWAVGFGGVSIWHYDGADWSEVPAPDLAGDGQAALTSVDGSGPDDLWAVGPQLDGSPVGASLALHARAFDSGAVVGSTGVSDAVVSWFGPESGLVDTDPSGNYQVGGLDVGTYTFIVTREGCTPITRDVTVKAGKTTTADIAVECD